MPDITEEKRAYDKKYRHNNKKVLKEKSDRYYSKTRKQRFIDNPERYLYSVAKARAKQFNIDFTIDIDDIVIPDTCPIMGYVLTKNDGYNPASASVDRVDNTKGYIKGNVRVISRYANLKKSSLTEKDLVKLLEYVRGVI